MSTIYSLKYAIDSFLSDIRYPPGNCDSSTSSSVRKFKERLFQVNPRYEPKTKGHLNIFWVGASYSQDHSGFLQALNEFGKVYSYHFKPDHYGPLNKSKPDAASFSLIEIRNYNDRSLLTQVKHLYSQRIKIDFLIGQMWGHLYSPEVLRQIRNLGIPVINISMDDRLPYVWNRVGGVQMGAIGLAPYLDLVLTSSPDRIERYIQADVPCIYFPMASSPKHFCFSSCLEKDIDVLFIGNNYGIRKKTIQHLLDEGVDVQAYGLGWPNGYADSNLAPNLFNRSKIILGIGTIANSNRSLTLKLRDFDAPMSKNLYITNRNPDLLKLFVEGSHIECYSCLDELTHKIKYYLDNDQARERIADRGYKHSLTHHTWHHRLHETFRTLGLIESKQIRSPNNRL